MWGGGLHLRLAAVDVPRAFLLSIGTSSYWKAPGCCSLTNH